MTVMKAASATLLVLREKTQLLLTPFYWSVTWLLNRILGHFTPYVGIEYKEPPDSDMFEDWGAVMATVLMMFFILAMIIFAMESRLTPDRMKQPYESLTLPEYAPSDPLKAEDGAPEDEAR